MRGKERSHSSAVWDGSIGQSMNLGREPPRHLLSNTPPLQPQCLHFHKFDNLIRLKDRVRNDSRFLMWFGEKKRWISIIQKGKKEGGFWMSNTNSGREVQTKRGGIWANKKKKKKEDIQNLLEWSLQRLNKHAISAFVVCFPVCSGLCCVIIFIKTIRLLSLSWRRFWEQHIRHSYMSIKINWYVGCYVFCLHIKVAESMPA